jgi:hypothetical protein
VESVKGVRSQFFGLSGISRQPKKNPHEPRIVKEKEFVEIAIMRRFRRYAQRCLLTLLHIR